MFWLFRSADFYPRPLCGERLYANFDGFYWWVISIHALLAESDLFHQVVQRRGVIFIHALLCGERPQNVTISIHALLAESDKVVFSKYTQYVSLRRAVPGQHFYPRSPCGERLLWALYSASIVAIFLSTLSLRRATQLLNFLLRVALISIHALLAESDRNQMQQGFNASIALGERPRKPTAIANTPKFLSTLSLRRATVSESASGSTKIHALLAESDARNIS